MLLCGGIQMTAAPLKGKWNNGLPMIDEVVIKDVAAAVEWLKSMLDEYFKDVVGRYASLALIVLNAGVFLAIFVVRN
jgi:hypothetical protein